MRSRVSPPPSCSVTTYALDDPPDESTSDMENGLPESTVASPGATRRSDAYMLATSADGYTAETIRSLADFGKAANGAASTSSAAAAAASLGLTVREVNSLFGETEPASRTAAEVISATSPADASASPASASSTTVERRSSSSGWLRSMSEATSAAVNLLESGRTRATYATAATAATAHAQIAHPAAAGISPSIARTAMCSSMATTAVATTAHAPRKRRMRRTRARLWSSFAAISAGIPCRLSFLFMREMPSFWLSTPPSAAPRRAGTAAAGSTA